jgi:hypothetical protein
MTADTTTSTKNPPRLSWSTPATLSSMTSTAATSNDVPAASITSSHRGGPAGAAGRGSGSGRLTAVVDHGRGRRVLPRPSWPTRP